jgi:hypothetical protein
MGFPIAAWGLVKYYGEDIKNKNVFLHLTSLDKLTKNDLQADRNLI